MIKNLCFLAFLIVSIFFDGVFIIFKFSQYQDFDNEEYAIKFLFPTLIGIVLVFFYVSAFVYFVKNLFQYKMIFFNSYLNYINFSLFLSSIVITSSLILDAISILNFENNDNIVLSNLNGKLDLLLKMPTNTVFLNFLLLSIIILLILFKNKKDFFQIVKKMVIFITMYIVSYVIIHASTLLFIQRYTIN